MRKSGKDLLEVEKAKTNNYFSKNNNANTPGVVTQRRNTIVVHNINTP